MTWIADGVHRTEAGHLIPQRAVVPALRGQTGTLHVGLGARVQGPIQHDGAVALSSRCLVGGDVRGGHEVIVGAGCVAGDIHCAGRVVVQDGARIGRIVAGSDVLLLGACRTGDVTAQGDIIIVGSPQTGRLQPSGRITTRPW